MDKWFKGVQKDVSKAMGMTNKSKTGASGAAGHRLGEALSEGQFRVRFAEASLGLALSGDLAVGAAVVASVVPGGEAARRGIEVGDVVVAVDDKPVESFVHASKMTKTKVRPLRFTLERPPAAAKVNGMKLGAPAVAAPAPAPAPAKKGKGKSKEPAVSDAERDRRRAAATAAAEQRSGQWDKKVRSTANKRLVGETRAANAAAAAAATGPAAPVSAATEAAMQRAAARESREAGLYTASMASSGLARTGTLSADGGGGGAGGGGATNGFSPAPAASPRSPAAAAALPAPPPLDDDTQAQLDEALGALVSTGAACGETLETAQKMLAKLASTNLGEKFRTVRLANPGFQRRVGGVQGGLELMLAAGFELRDGGEAVLYYVKDAAAAGGCAVRIAEVRAGMA